MNLSAKGVGSVGITLLVFGLYSCFAQSSLSDKHIPKSVDEAVSLLEPELTSRARDYLLRTPREEAQAELHFPAGMDVRNRFELWGGQNPELMKSCGVRHPDDCSWIIFGRLWDAVRSEADPELVRRLDCQFQLSETIQINYQGFDQLTTGGLLQTLQAQIDEQISKLKVLGTPPCESSLSLHPIGNPKLDCFVRAEFAHEDKTKEIALSRLLGWVAWRNDFDTVHEPPVITLKFRNRCAWPKRPQF